MANPTLEELKAALAAKRALPEEEQIFVDPPLVQIRRGPCSECGKDTSPAITFGWGMIEDAVRLEQEIPNHTGGLCMDCE